ncbi:MAG: ribonuclease [Firmicutes bacterium]|nr:ribonuclease [Bacillota bacterium]
MHCRKDTNNLGRKEMRKISGWKKCLLILWTVFLFISLAGCGATSINSPSERPGSNISSPKEQAANPVPVKKGESYSTRDEVAAYIFEFHTLPPNYITKAEAQKLGWDNSKGNLWQVTSQKSIGGDRFGNMEGLLPKANGRQYYECDIEFYGGYRGAKRIIYSNDGLIFYTDDHYKTFKRLY